MNAANTKPPPLEHPSSASSASSTPSIHSIKHTPHQIYILNSSHHTTTLPLPLPSLSNTNGPPPGPLASKLTVTLLFSLTTRTVSPTFFQSTSHAVLIPPEPDASLLRSQTRSLWQDLS
ncbi:hypothetical protein E4U28_007146, partial [Claviceps purpurea]